MLLHTVSKSPFTSDALDCCLRTALDGSVILLLEDGVYAAIADTAPARRLEEHTKLQCFALAADIRARGLQQLAPHIQLASYDDFVRLSVECHAVQSWY